MLIGSVISVSLSANAEMGQIWGISTPLQPGEVFSVNVTIEDSGSLILWFWDASRTNSLRFWLETPDNHTYTFDAESYGVPQRYGFLAYQTGIYVFHWQNGHDLFPTTISFIITTTLPRIQLTSPASGSTVTSIEQKVHGICNGFATSIEISDNTGFATPRTEWDPINMNTNWTVDLSLSPGRNDLWVRATYSCGDFTFTKSESFHIYMDTLWFYNDHGETKVGVGILTVSVLGVLVLSGVVFLTRRKKRRGRT
jgi:hypothetical protein